MSDQPRDDVNRREFLKASGAAVAAGAVALRGRASLDAQGARPPFAAPKIDDVRIGYVGVGLQGGGHVQNLLRIPGCRITAVGDIREERTKWATDRKPKRRFSSPVWPRIRPICRRARGCSTRSTCSTG